MYIHYLDATSPIMSWLTSSNHVSVSGVTFVRIIVGTLLVIHGTQVFNQQEMASYGPWMKDLGVPMPLTSAYAGKIIELLGGVCLILGIYLRAANILLMATFLFITIVMGEGKVFTDGQHPFLFFYSRFFSFFMEMAVSP
jgi:putative oxidoreductase